MTEQEFILLCFLGSSFVFKSSGNIHQSDHFLMEKDEFRRCKDCGATARVVDSDHSAVLLKLRISCDLKRKSDPRQKMASYKYSGLNTDSEDSREFSERFCRHVGEVAATVQGNAYMKLQKGLSSAVQQLPKREKLAFPWFVEDAEELRRLIKIRNELYASLEKEDTRNKAQLRKQLRLARWNLKSRIKAAKNAWICSQMDDMNGASDAFTGTKKCWDAMKKLKGGLGVTQTSAPAKMKKADGTYAKSPEENAEVFEHHFEKLYGREPSFDFSVLDDIDQHEILEALDERPSSRRWTMRCASYAKQHQGRRG